MKLQIILLLAILLITIECAVKKKRHAKHKHEQGEEEEQAAEAGEQVAEAGEEEGLPQGVQSPAEQPLVVPHLVVQNSDKLVRLDKKELKAKSSIKRYKESVEAALSGILADDMAAMKKERLKSQAWYKHGTQYDPADNNYKEVKFDRCLGNDLYYQMHESDCRALPGLEDARGIPSEKKKVEESDPAAESDEPAAESDESAAEPAAESRKKFRFSRRHHRGVHHEKKHHHRRFHRRH